MQQNLIIKNLFLTYFRRTVFPAESKLCICKQVIPEKVIQSIIHNSKTLLQVISGDIG